MKYFKFEQFAISNTAKRRGIDNSVPQKFQPRAAELVDMILDPLREAWGSGIDMTSGYRCEELNNAIGGSKTSAHSHAYAADLVPSNGKVEEFKEFTMHWLQDNNIKFDQYINEYKGNSSWVHIGIRNGSGQQRQQYKLFYGGKYTKIDPNTFKGISNYNTNVQTENVQAGQVNTASNDMGITTNTGITYENFTTGGGITQTGNTEGLLTASSIYIKSMHELSNDNEQIKNNNIYQKDENGDPILDEFGNPTVTDDYLYGFDEGDDMIDDEDVPKVEEVYPKITDTTNNISSDTLNLSEESNNKIPSSVDNNYLSDKDKRKNISIEKWKKKSEDLSLGEAKEKLYEWLSQQSIMIQNAFHVLIIKDMIDKIKTLIQQLQNTSQFNMMVLFNSINDVLSIFEDLGISPAAEGLTIEDLKKLGVGVAGTSVETAVNISNQVAANAQQATEDFINQSVKTIQEQSGSVLNSDVIGSTQSHAGMITDIVSNATDTVNNTVEQISTNVNSISNNIESSDKYQNNTTDNWKSSLLTTISNNSSHKDNTLTHESSKEYISDSKTRNKVINVDYLKSTGSAIVASLTNNGINNVNNTVQNATNDVINGTETMMADITKPFTYTQNNKEKYIYINITINKNPRAHLISITQFIDSFKYGNNKKIFNTGLHKQIKDAFYDAWDINDAVELELHAIVDGVTKFYVFTIIPNKSTRNNQENVEQLNSNEVLLSINGDTAINSLTDNVSNTINNTGAELNSLKENITNKAQNISSNAKNLANNALDSAANIANSELSQLTNTNMARIEDILKGKVLMFNEIVEALKILLQIVKTLQVICHLLENYMINKQFVKDKCNVDLGNAIKQAAQLINGLEGIVNLKDTNFFTIRTQEMADWVKNEFKNAEIKDGLMVIGKIDSVGKVLSQLTGNNADTIKLNTYCTTHKIQPEIPLDLTKGTKLYFDDWSIKNGNYLDGTTIGLDNIGVNNINGEIYYDASARSTISSEILRARKKNINPYQDIADTSVSIDNLLKTISFNSDEIEGTQTLNMCDLNMCPPAPESVPDAEKSAIIIEFGDEYTLGNKVDYTITVKPGQSITDKTILGYIKKDGKQKPIRTKYTGIVRSIDNYNSDYYHLYPSIAKRHFIIDDYTLCMPSDYNINDVMDLSKKFQKATELEAFIINCMPISILPLILAKANRDRQLVNNEIQPLSANGYEEYNNLISLYDTKINNLNSSLLEFGGADKIKPHASSDNSNTSIYHFSDGDKTFVKTKIGDTSIRMDKMLNIRQQMIDAAISTYNNVINIKNYMLNDTKIIGDENYIDCIGLSFNTDDNNQIFTRNSSDDKIEYQNYYINLLKCIPESSKQQMEPINIDLDDINKNVSELFQSSGSPTNVDLTTNIFIENIQNATKQINNLNKNDNEKTYIDEYRELITNIIDRRLTFEENTNNNKQNHEILTIFNTYYNKNILGQFRTVADPFNYLKQRLEKSNALNDKNKILNQIKFDKLGKEFLLYNENNDPELNEIIKKNWNSFNAEQNEYIKNKKHRNYYEVCQQALTMFMYLLNTNVSKNIIESSSNYKLNIELSGNYKSNTESSSFYVKTISTYKNGKREIIDTYKKLIEDEAAEIEKFWNKVLDAYKSELNFNNAKQSLTDYANNMNGNVQWPQSINIKIDNTNYELYTFTDPFKDDEKQLDDFLFNDDMQGNINIPDPVIDLNNLPEPRDRDKITIIDYEYWLVYMLNATLFTLMPTYWADGFDVLPFMTPTPLPAIYLPIAPPVMIPVVNVLMVFGIALRGIWPMPIILMVNLTSNNIDVMVFMKIALEIIKDIFKKSKELMENGIPMMINEISNNYISENQIAQKAIDKFKTYSSIIHAIPIEDKALIEKKFNEALVDEMNKQTKLNVANEKLEKTKNKLKNFDRRQVITRESDLGNGPEPM